MNESKKVEVITLEDGKKYIKIFDDLTQSMKQYPLISGSDFMDDTDYESDLFMKVIPMANIIKNHEEIPLQIGESYMLSDKGIKHFGLL